jgi:hypothetical protein
VQRKGADAKEVAMHGGTFYMLSSGIESAHAEVSRGEARRRARSAHTKSREVEDRLDRAMLACEAMWTLLQDKLGLTEEMLLERITQLDLSDGKLDGKVVRPVAPCPHCKRPNSARFIHCVYCGQALPRAPFA